MSEAVEFEIPDAGAPALGDGESPYDQQAPPDLSQIKIVTGWTQDEAAQVVGGMVANLTIVLYAMRWHAPPPMELAPAIAGDPKTEFPLMGLGLAPILDFVAPKGSAAAVGVSLTAGIGEVVSAVARRSVVLNHPPKQQQQRPVPQAPAAAPPPDGEPGGFRYGREELRVLQAGAYEAMGVSV